MRCADLRGFGPVGTNGPAPVDVLAVMARDAEHAAAYRLAHGYADGSLMVPTQEAAAARAAVAELIAADKALDSATARRIEARNRITSGDHSDDAFRRQASADHSYDRAVDRRRTALANIGAAQ